MSCPVINVENLDVRFIVRPYRHRSLFEALSSLAGKEPRREIWALQEVSLSLERGDVVGVIGPNGSGKTTLLKILAGVIPPSNGKVSVEGRVGTLIELGAGFHPELTGAENVYLQGALLGLGREQMKERFARIVDFSGLGDFIEIPVKDYSAGMYVRLAFSIAAEVEAEALLIDEILAVGDLEFQRKSYDRISQMISEGATALIASHDLEMIQRVCDRAIVLQSGRVVFDGAPRDAVATYHSMVAGSTDELLPSEGEEMELEHEYSGQTGVRIEGFEPEGNGIVGVTKVVFLDDNGTERSEFTSDESLRIRIEYAARERTPHPVFGIAIYRNDWVLVAGPNTQSGRCEIESVEGTGFVEFTVPGMSLAPGDYLLIASIFAEDLTTPYDHSRLFYELRMSPRQQPTPLGHVELGGSWRHVEGV